MEVLVFNDLEVGKLKKPLDKVLTMLKSGDFKSADVKKMPNVGYFRAKLDDTNRLLFKIGKLENKKYIFILEVIHNHDYAKSRFLNGANVDENKLQPLVSLDTTTEIDFTSIAYINPKHKTFNLLDKILSFDDKQEETVNLPPPLILIGSAGSGKTAIILEKIKFLSGNILYISLSPFLIENAKNVYSTFDYQNIVTPNFNTSS